MERNKFKNIVCCDSEYSLFIYLLVTNYNINESLFFYSQRLNKIYRDKLSENGICLKTYRGKSRLVAFFINVVYFLYVYFILTIKRAKGLPAYGFDFLQFSSAIIMLSSSFSLIEDGLGNYEEPNIVLDAYKRSKLKRCLNYWGLYYPSWGVSKSVERIFLTSLSTIPSSVENKVVKINLQDQWFSLDSSRKEILLNFFLGDVSLSNNSNRCLILTQCWSEYKIMTEQQKVDVYRRIIDIVRNSKQYDEILLKVHPAETTDYKQYFPEVEVLIYPVPLQILELIGYNFKTMITVNSTAIFTSKCEHKILLIDEHIDEKTLYRDILNRLEQVEI